MTDLYQYETDFVVRTKTKLKTPMVRTQSIVSVSEASKTIKDGKREKLDHACFRGLTTILFSFPQELTDRQLKCGDGGIPRRS